MARILALVLLLPACATSMQMSPRDVADVSEDEGIVIGSVLVLVEAGAPPGCWLMKPDRFKVTVSDFDFDWTAEYDFYLDLMPEEEAVFVTRMKAGEYRFHRLDLESGPLRLLTNLEVVLDVRFKVEAGRPVYVGRLVLHLPPVLQLDETVRVTVENPREEALSETGKTYGSVVDDAVTDLMLACDLPSTVCMELAPRRITRKKEPYLGPAPTWQLPPPPKRPPPKLPEPPKPPPRSRW